MSASGKCEFRRKVFSRDRGAHVALLDATFFFIIMFILLASVHSFTVSELGSTYSGNGVQRSVELCLHTLLQCDIYQPAVKGSSGEVFLPSQSVCTLLRMIPDLSVVYDTSSLERSIVSLAMSLMESRLLGIVLIHGQASQGGGVSIFLEGSQQYPASIGHGVSSASFVISSPEENRSYLEVVLYVTVQS